MPHICCIYSLDSLGHKNASFLPSPLPSEKKRPTIFSGLVCAYDMLKFIPKFTC